MSLKSSLRILYRAIEKWSENGGMRLGAALSYYTLFSISPLLLIALYVSGAVFGEDAARGRVHAQLNSLMGDNVAKAVEKMVEKAAEPQETQWTPWLSFALMIVAALGAFLYLRSTLCIIWRLEPPHGNTWLGMLWDYTLAVIMVFIVAILLLAALAASLVIPIVQKMMQEQLLAHEHYLQWIEIATSFAFLTLLFACCYRVLSGGRISWGYVWYGSFIAAVLFTIGKTLLAFYLVYSGTADAYGAAGSVVVFLVWVYYSSQVLFFGAELIQARRTRHEWMDGPKQEPPPVIV
jgi:membrane protein